MGARDDVEKPSIAPHGAQQGTPGEPQAPGDLAAILAPLADRESAFVKAVLMGEPFEEAAKTAGYVMYPGRLQVVDLLGRPRVRLALKLSAPLLADQRLAYRILSPFALERAVGVLDSADSPQQSLSAARDIQDRAGYAAPEGPGSKSFETILRQLRSRRTVAGKLPDALDVTPRTLSQARLGAKVPAGVVGEDPGDSRSPGAPEPEDEG